VVNTYLWNKKTDRPKIQNMSANRALSILLADDHPVVRRGVRRLLELHGEWKVCGEAGCGSEAVRKAMKFKPNLALLDISMPDLSGFEAAVEIRRASPQTKVIIFTMHYSEEFIRGAAKAGAKGYVLKSDAEADLVTAINEVVKGRTFFTAAGTDVVLARAASPATAASEAEGLTRREYQVLRLVAEGKTNKQLASELGISTRTAENHRASIMRKLNLHSTSELVRYAVRKRMVTP